MPELPEVETIARGVDSRVRGDVIVDSWFSSHREPFKTRPARQAKGLAERSILSVHRAGKHIVVELGPQREAGVVSDRKFDQGGHSSAQWIVHLGMTGRLLVTTPDGPVARTLMPGSHWPAAGNSASLTLGVLEGWSSATFSAPTGLQRQAQIP